MLLHLPSLSVSVCVCLSVRLPACLSVHLSLCLSVSISVAVCMSLCLSVLATVCVYHVTFCTHKPAEEATKTTKTLDNLWQLARWPYLCF
jgi:hypothetical protein